MQMEKNRRLQARGFKVSPKAGQGCQLDKHRETKEALKRADRGERPTDILRETDNGELYATLHKC